MIIINYPTINKITMDTYVRNDLLDYIVHTFYPFSPYPRLPHLNGCNCFLPNSFDKIELINLGPDYILLINLSFIVIRGKTYFYLAIIFFI